MQQIDSPFGNCSPFPSSIFTCFFHRPEVHSLKATSVISGLCLHSDPLFNLLSDFLDILYDILSGFFSDLLSKFLSHNNTLVGVGDPSPLPRLHQNHSGAVIRPDFSFLVTHWLDLVGILRLKQEALLTSKIARLLTSALTIVFCQSCSRQIQFGAGAPCRDHLSGRIQ